MVRHGNACQGQGKPWQEQGISKTLQALARTRNAKPGRAKHGKANVRQGIARQGKDKADGNLRVSSVR